MYVSPTSCKVKKLLQPNVNYMERKIEPINGQKFCYPKAVLMAVRQHVKSIYYFGVLLWRKQILKWLFGDVDINFMKMSTELS